MKVETTILSRLVEIADSNFERTAYLLLLKEKRLHERISKKVRLRWIMKQDKNIQSSRMFQKSDGGFYKQKGSMTEHMGVTPSMNKFTSYRAGI